MDFEKLQEVIVEVLNVDVSEVKEETTFTGDLGADSLDVFQIIMRIEEEFGITVDSDRAKEVVTVGDAMRLIKDSSK